MSLRVFEPFSALHAVVVTLFVLLTAAVILASRGLSPAALDRRRMVIGLVMLAVQVVYQIYWIGFRGDSGEALPLFLCDLAGAIAVAAFLFPVRLLRALLYYWGMGLSILAFVIPVLESGPITLEFWLFWFSHWVIVGGAAYLVMVDRYRPGWLDLVWASAAMLVYGLMTLAINVRLGSNYMYTGDHPMPTPGDLELAWPLPRLLVFAAAALALMLAAHLPFALRREEIR